MCAASIESAQCTSDRDYKKEIHHCARVVECPAYGISGWNDTWGGTDDNDAYEKMLKLSHKHITDVPAAQSCMLIVATYCDCAVTS